MARVVLVLAASLPLLAQPDTAMLRRVYEEALARRQAQFGATDARTAQAARDLGLFLQRSSDTAAARRALAETVRIDEKAFGVSATQTLEDVSSLASISPAAQAEPLLRRAIESPDPTVAGPALTTLAEMRRKAGDRAGAAALLRRALPLAESATGKDDPVVALVLRALAQVVDPKEAAPLLQRAQAIERRAAGGR